MKKKLKSIKIKLPLTLEVISEKELKEYVFNPSKKKKEENLIIILPKEVLEIEEEED